MKSNKWFEQGFQACMEGFLFSSNPYQHASQECADWRDGWREAEPIRAEIERAYAEMWADD